MKTAFSILALIVLTSCGKVTEEFLYDKHDKEYQALLAMKEKKCQEDSEAFQELKNRNNFVAAGYKSDSYYEVQIEVNGVKQSSEYLQISNVNTDRMFISYDAKNDARNMTIDYKSSDNNALIGLIATGVCSQLKTSYTANKRDLESRTMFTFNDERMKVLARDDRGNPKFYDQELYVFNVDINDLPVIFLHWNKKFTKIEKNNTEVKNIYEYKIVKISREDCGSSKHPGCGENGWNFPSKILNVEAIRDAYKSDALTSKIIEFVEGESAL